MVKVTGYDSIERGETSPGLECGAASNQLVLLEEGGRIAAGGENEVGVLSSRKCLPDRELKFPEDPVSPPKVRHNRDRWHWRLWLRPPINPPFRKQGSQATIVIRPPTTCLASSPGAFYLLSTSTIPTSELRNPPRATRVSAQATEVDPVYQSTF